MTGIVIGKKREVASLQSLIQLAIRYVYDKKYMGADEIALMQESIVDWNNKVDLTENDQYLLQRLGWFLKKNEDGEFEERKELFAKKGVDFAKFHRMPWLNRRR